MMKDALSQEAGKPPDMFSFFFYILLRYIYLYVFLLVLEYHCFCNAIPQDEQY